MTEIFCANFQAIVTAIDSEENTRLLARTRCKMWSCEYCAERNRKIWQARVIGHINNNNGLDWSWFTLTAHSKKRGKKLSLENLRGAWEKIIKRIQRKYSSVEKIHYCRVYEQHKDGSYHIHCIISIKFDDIKERVNKKTGEKTKYSVWLQKTAREMKLGYYTHAANFEGKHAGYIAGYVTKYMTKLTPEFKSELGRVRHIQTSQGWLDYENENELSWELKAGYYENELLTDMENKTKVLDVQTGEFITFDNFQDTYIYPSEFDHRNK